MLTFFFFSFPCSFVKPTKAAPAWERRLRRSARSRGRDARRCPCSQQARRGTSTPSAARRAAVARRQRCLNQKTAAGGNKREPQRPPRPQQLSNPGRYSAHLFYEAPGELQLQLLTLSALLIDVNGSIISERSLFLFIIWKIQVKEKKQQENLHSERQQSASQSHQVQNCAPASRAVLTVLIWQPKSIQGSQQPQ